ncbi:NAD(P)H-dependent oxidoreductase [Streptomyces sp. CB01881]|uniref:FMN-dependent NADH-azoreductase n=1 Tax=Streptomyces sp. CB01881 TaxID=2078691 RepID=UPI000CDC2F72|nr:NAD(P)H-dependent oxidoreductase [Streptomyces sp. CB01881]AUY52258.1 FMN-dependent NADH-azoreductase [Streptomyces sp. CB01881]TYC71679.1 FMN-dependent NADH-azoreductase [Streptomyces sp. CB01881]
MSTLLYLNSSARTDSFSRRLGDAFTTAWRDAGGGEVVHRDLAAQPVPPIGEGWTRICDTLLREGITDIARYGEAVRTAQEREAWALVRPLLDELVAADVVLIGAPMYNFGIPAALKAWIDQVTFPKMVLAPRKFVVVAGRGGAYGPGTPREPFDHHGRYLLDFFRGHYAVEDGEVVAAELVNSLVDPGLAGRRTQHQESAAGALHRAGELGAKLAGHRIPREG